ncbi:hypothetical protein BCR34DRAFT_607869 [Clohesyomyces aquaticus]|uniref:Ubiquitin-like protease family profile domain-containing protein n=1 Tax=Clohesyomyces aquaticus TaxID=1231657 RepID=A0A1Y1YCI3_9PLEO|nr:hypothetical protein BCR34DRAFT_607869 [Clohesyomyces aquaticus]
MPPKRKSSKEPSGSCPTKKKRIEIDSENRVRWIRPRTAPGDDDLEIPREFARGLFGRDWDQVENALDPIRMEFAPVCSPLGRLTKKASEENTMTHRMNKSSPNLKSFWKKVNDKWRGGKGGRTPIWRILDSLGPGVAGAGFWTGNEIEFQALEDDSRITVTTRGQRYQFDLLRVQPGSGGEPRYFIELPHNGSISVNGQTIINGYNNPDRLLIGPLNTFAVIEVRGHTIFWWMPAGLQYNTQGRMVSDQESLRRERIHYNDDVEGYIRLDDIAVPRPLLPRWPGYVLTASDDKEEEEEDVEEEIEEDEDLALNNDQVAGTGMAEDNVQPTDGQVVFADIHPCAYLEQNLPALRKEAESIRQEAVDELKNFPQDLSQAIIEAVLRAINVRQANTAAFGLVGRELNDVECLRDGYFYPRGTHPGRPLIASLRLENHTVLLVLQRQADKTVSMHVFDHRNWILGPEQRNRIFLAGIGLLRRTRWWGAIHGGDAECSAPKPGKALWVQCSQYPGKSESVGVCLTILSAWALAMGLELNQKFTIANEEQFKGEVRDLFYVALQGKTLDWKLMLAFFRCRKFVSDRVPMPPPNRRFTLDDARINEDMRVNLPHDTDRRERIGEDSRGQDNVSGNHAAADQTSGNIVGVGEFLSDGWNKRDRMIRVPRLLEVGAFRSQISRDELRQEYLKHPVVGLDLPQKFKECAYFRKEIEALLEENGASAWLDGLRNAEDNDTLVPSTEGQYVREDEVHLCIASVVLAITERQSMKGGFSMMGINNLSLCQFKEYTGPIGHATRFGRPMLLPLVHENHTVLVVMQLDEKRRPHLSVVDSRIWQYPKEHRQMVYAKALKILMRSAWWRNVYRDEDSLQLPPKATWIPSAQQRDHWTCGYYAIANAWALAMGLELNSMDMPPRDPRFIPDMRNIAHLAIGGFVDWRLIYSFLWCYRIVKPDQAVVASRRFGSTTPLSNESDIDMELEDIAFDEDLYWLEQEHPDWGILGQESAVTLHGGYPHDTNFASDSWDFDIRHNIIPDLILLSRYDGSPLTPGCVLKELWKSEQPAEIAKGFWKTTIGKSMRSKIDKLDDSEGDSEDEPEDTVPSVFQNTVRAFFKHLEKLDATKKASRHNLIESAPSDFFSRYFNYMNAFEQGLRKDNFEVMELPGMKELLSDCQVTSAIASVVEAIDAIEDTGENYQGGLALAESTQVSMARAESCTEDLPWLIVSRARRCWLLPFVVHKEFAGEIEALREKGGMHVERGEGSENTGHIFLVVLQEEEGEFRSYILDSARDYFKDVRDFLYQRIQKTARYLHWSTHRNDSRDVDFSDSYWIVKVPRQNNNWACGYHTILNAWILALGLTPNTEEEVDEDDYQILYALVQKALAGLLSWEILVTFLFCRRLVRESSLQDVPENRRFLSTVRQFGEDDIGNFVKDKFNNSDQYLATDPENDKPYDHGLNVDFTKMDKKDLKEIEYKEFEALNRRYESEEEEELLEGGGALFRSSHAFRNSFMALSSDIGETSDPLEFLDRQGLDDISSSDVEMACPG